MPELAQAPVQAPQPTPTPSQERAPAPAVDGSNSASASRVAAATPGSGQPETPTLSAVELAVRRSELDNVRDRLARARGSSAAAAEAVRAGTPGASRGQGQLDGEISELEARERSLTGELDEHAWSSGMPLDLRRSAEYSWGEDGLQRDVRDAKTADEVTPASPHERKIGHDFSPEAVKELNKEIKTWCDAHAAELRADLAEWYPGVPPEVKLEGKITAGQVDFGQGSGEASVELKASIQSVGAISKLAIAFGASPDVFNPKVSFLLGGETLEGEAKWDLVATYGAEAAVAAKIGTSSEGVRDTVGRLFGAIRGGVERDAEEAGAQAAEQGTDVSNGMPKAPAEQGDGAKQDKPLATAGVQGSFFAGVQGKAQVEAGATWKKRDASSYTEGLQRVVSLVAEVAGCDEDTIEAILHDSDREAEVAGWLFGDAGDAQLLKASAEAGVQAGLSLAGALAVEFGIGQPLKFKVEGSATMGVGGSGKTTIEADPVEIARIALITAGYFTDPQVQARIAALGPWLWERLQTLPGIEQLTDDDRARQAVAEGRHEDMEQEQRQDLLERMISGMTLDDDEEMILDLLDDSASRGGFDLADLIEEVGFFRLVNSFHGAQWRRLKRRLRWDYYEQASTSDLVDIVAHCVSGGTADWEEGVIVDVLCAVDSSVSGRILDRVGFYDVLNNTTGTHWQRLQSRLHSTLYRDNTTRLDDWVQELVSGTTADWEVVEIVEMMTTSTSSARWIVDEVGFLDLWDELSDADADAMQTSLEAVYDSWSTDEKVEAINGLIGAPCTDKDEEHIMLILWTTSDSEFEEIIEQVGYYTFCFQLTGANQDQFDAWYEAL